MDITKLDGKKNINTLDKDDSICNWYTKKEIKDMNVMPNIVKDIMDSEEINHHIIKEY